MLFLNYSFLAVYQRILAGNGIHKEGEGVGFTFRPMRKLHRVRKNLEYEAKRPKKMVQGLKPTFIPGQLRHD